MQYRFGKAVIDDWDAMSFVFINNNAPIDVATRRRIREHAATGKNVGRRHLNRGRRKLAQPSTIEARAPAGEDVLEEVHIGSGPIDTFSLPPYSLPVARSTPRLRRHVHNTFITFQKYASMPGLEYVVDLEALRAPSIWTQLVFTDEAYFHCTIAISILATNRVAPVPEDIPDALGHVAKAIHLLNSRLSKGTDDAVSDQNIATIVSMAKYEFAAGHSREGHIHLDGLHRMVQLRGGIAAMTRKDATFTQKIFRVDFDWALFLGTATRYAVDDVLLNSQDIIGPTEHGEEDMESHVPAPLLGQLKPELRSLLIDTAQFGRMITATASRSNKIRIDTLHCHLMLLGYRLIQVCPLSRPLLDNRIDKAMHAGMIMFIMTFLGIGGRVIENPFLPQLVIAVLHDFGGGHRFDGRVLDEALLWVLLMANAAKLMGPSDEDWFMPSLQHLSARLGLEAWEDAAPVVSKFPWVASLHDGPACSLWQRLLRTS
ncbi:hypothetical protein B0I35DRAFT_472555 [Stachybotrys elegans]|uniref:Transcription factor domain-containing protein n=1 Tax=Stachybotrys elegans TaxID=80388 RepID=A0A8K0T0S6_9HYPO|nr:hypothetical protein B0I35DRAFT_472555 [Stachybotrys elegans]